MAKTSQLADTIATIESAILEYRRLPDSNIMIKVAILNSISFLLNSMLIYIGVIRLKMS
ncbi:hypothetical protein IC611_10275 [Proteus mirabilis]